MSAIGFHGLIFSLAKSILSITLEDAWQMEAAAVSVHTIRPESLTRMADIQDIKTDYRRVLFCKVRRYNLSLCRVSSRGPTTGRTQLSGSSVVGSQDEDHSTMP